MEAIAERAAAFYQVGLAVQQQVPFSDAILVGGGALTEGSEHIDFELQVHLHEKAEPWATLPNTQAPDRRPLVLNRLGHPVSGPERRLGG